MQVPWQGTVPATAAEKLSLLDQKQLGDSLCQWRGHLCHWLCGGVLGQSLLAFHVLYPTTPHTPKSVTGRWVQCTCLASVPEAPGSSTGTASTAGKSAERFGEGHAWHSSAFTKAEGTLPLTSMRFFLPLWEAVLEVLHWDRPYQV